ncbi:MAG: PilC/PilY family type IV pilus protein [Desulfobacterales bacterium]
MFNHNDVTSYLQRLRHQHWLQVLVIEFCVLTAGVLFFGAMLAHGEVDLADAPMFTKINPPPTNLMILQDDSGSMTYEILVRGEYDGKFPNPDRSDTEGFCYVFDNMGDGYNYTDPGRHMEEAGREYWRSQWYEINVVYYNPNIVYEPWPSHAGQTFLPADTNKPLVHPLPKYTKNTLDLDEKALKVGKVTIPWAHYFVRAANTTVYLVIMDGKGKANKYYTFTTDDGIAPNDKITSVTPADPPPDIARVYAEDRQNFANWFSYHRRREFVAKAAIARVLKELDGVRVGILGINNRVIVPLKPVKAVIDGEYKDEVDVIIDFLYDYRSSGGTPLKQGLEKVGEYFQVNDGNLEGQKGDAPYPAEGGACQQSFTIVVTDGYYSDTSHTSVGNADGDKDNAGWGGGIQPYTDAYKDTLADIAMYYYATDLSPDAEDLPKGDGFEDLLPTNKWDGAAHQHMVTFAVAFGVSGTLNPDDYEDDRTSANYMKSITDGDYVVWPEVPGDRQPESIDDLWHATVNGRGVFVNAGEPQKLVEGLLQIIKDIQERQPTSGASVSVNGDWLFGKIGPDVLIFQGSYSYIDDEWAGEVSAYRLDEISGQVITDPPEWLASEKLQAKAWDTRNILTYNGSTSGLPFTYADLTDEHKLKLGVDAESVVNFIRGKDPDSSGNRSNMLGDIVHSSPVFIDDAVYVGANDGMLHAFKASDGTELFGYVPYLVFDQLKDLADPDYEHSFYVDLTPTVKKGEKLLADSGDQTILVGGLGKGGKGYFALDITNPHAMSKDQVLWEFPRKDIAMADVEDMGYSYSKPVVVRSYNTAHPWIVIFGNGYNSSPDGNSVLFILDAKTGEVIQRIPAGTGPNNGLSSPIAVDVDFDDIVDFIYAGDLRGNLWKFDLTSTKDSEWEVAYKDGVAGVPLFTAIDPDGNRQPITSKPDVMFHPEQHGLIVCFGTGKFLGTDDFSNIQLQTIYGIWDYGDRAFQPGDGWSEDDNKEYLGAFNPEATAQLSNQPATVKLLKQVASEVKVGSGEDEVIVRVLTDEEPKWETTPDPSPDQLPNPSHLVPNDAGWYLDLDVYTGERVISDVIIRDGILIVIGFIPEQTFCGAGGESVFMELNAFTGGQLAGVNFDIHDDESVGEDDYVEIEVGGNMIKVPPSGIKLAGNIQPPAIIKLNDKTEKKYLSSSGGGIVEITERAVKTGIAYWMEIRQ